MPEIAVIILQLVFFLSLSPLLSGLISRIKNNIRLRKGQSVFQPYYNLAKLFSKGEVISRDSSWIFRAAPFAAFASVLSAAVLIPVFIYSAPARAMGDFLALIFIFSLGRFFMALAALDAGSAFGGMGSSREMFISSLAEPALCLAVFSLNIKFGSTDISAFSGMHSVPASCVVAAVALFLVAIAETSRVPVDNQETHLELTMIHEAMTLEYSGRSLAFIEMASYIKQAIWFFLIAQIIFPISLAGSGGFERFFLWFIWYPARIVIIVFSVALLETAVAKMRLFRVTDFLGFAFALGIISAACAALGV